ncbi:hypothetical protein [Pectinatus frisingensis]|jgi:hypothetical protein|nr:hypothetical protein [Pectinatus frisingensis]
MNEIIHGPASDGEGISKRQYFCAAVMRYVFMTFIHFADEGFFREHSPV